MTHHSNQLIQKEQNRFYNSVKEIITKVVVRYIARGVIPKREQQDVETAIIEKFLSKQDKIDNAFQGKAKKTTYYTAVINRMCAEIIRKEQNHWYAVNENNDSSFSHDRSLSFETEKQMLIQEELKRFRAGIMLFNGSQAKVLLFLKYYYDIPLQNSDVTNYAGSKDHEALKILGKRNNLSKAEVNSRLAQLVMLVENKNISGDAVRMWLNKQIDILLCRLNGKNKSFHNKETIGVMLEMQYNSSESVN
ncbi:MAG: hypothetical protein R6V32_11915 [Bacteroidales bacterium]